MRPCLDVDLFMTYRCDLLFSFTLIIINQIISLKQTHLFFAIFLQYTLLLLEIKKSKRKKRKQIIFQKQKFIFRVLLSFCLIFSANFSLVLLIKKSMYSISEMLVNTLLVNLFKLSTLLFTAFFQPFCVFIVWLSKYSSNLSM